MTDQWARWRAGELQEQQRRDRRESRKAKEKEIKADLEARNRAAGSRARLQLQRKKDDQVAKKNGHHVINSPVVLDTDPTDPFQTLRDENDVGLLRNEKHL